MADTDMQDELVNNKPKPNKNFCASVARQQKMLGVLFFYQIMSSQKTDEQRGVTYKNLFWGQYNLRDTSFFLSDVDWLPKIKMAATQTGNRNKNWTDWACNPIPTDTPTFAIMPDTFVTLTLLTDVGWLPEFKMAATTSGFNGRNLEFR